MAESFDEQHFTEFGVFLRYLRRRAQMSQAEVALATGYSEAQISRLELNRRRPDRATMLALFVPALQIEDEPRLIRHLLRLATPAHDSSKEEQSPRAPEAIVGDRPALSGNLPHQQTRFLGREAELAQIKALITHETCHILSVIGPGGIGKTRLAVQAAALLGSRFAHGITFIPLAHISSEPFVLSAIADALALVVSSHTDPKTQLLHYLADKQMLLILDNFEHLMAAADLLSDIVLAAPHVKLLITSRERLNLYGEWLIEVYGLPIPKQTTVETLAQSSIGHLFIQSVQRLQPAFTINEANHTAVLRICQLLEGMPLGIELAAAWVRFLSCAEIAQEIEHTFDFLKSDLRDVPQRHRSLRTIFTYSWTLLSAHERTICSALSVFRGSFDRGAAAAVAGASIHDLVLLVNKSMLRCVNGRYDMHELVRQYAAEDLQAHPMASIQAHTAHCQYILQWLSSLETGIKSEHQEVTLALISQDIGNIRAAWEWCLQQHSSLPLRNALRTLFYFYDFRAWFHEGRLFMERVLAACREWSASDDTNAERIMLGLSLAFLGWLSGRCGHIDGGCDFLEEGVGILRTTDDAQSLADAMTYLALVMNMQDDPGAERSLLDESLAIRQSHDQWGRSYTLYALGKVALNRGRYEDARHFLQQSLHIIRETGEQRGIIFVLNRTGEVALALEDYIAAETAFQESSWLSMHMKDDRCIADSFHQMGLVALAQRSLSEAQYFLSESLVLFERTQDQWNIAQNLNNLGLVAYDLGHLTTAQSYFAKAVEVATTYKMTSIVYNALLGQAMVLAARDLFEPAVTFLSFLLLSTTNDQTPP